MRVEVNGQPVFAHTGGRPFDPALPCLVFIHGAQHDHFVWMQQIRAFAGPQFSILALDLPGHGQSGGAPLTSIEALADWLLAVLEKVGADGMAKKGPGSIYEDKSNQATFSKSSLAPFSPFSLFLIGHSMGSLIALEAAARAQEMVSHVVLVGAAVPMPVAPALLDAARDDPTAAMALINQWAHSPRALRGGCGGMGLWLPGVNLRIMERQPATALYTDLYACNAYANGPAALAQLACPVTLIAGRSDRMTSVKASRRLAEQVRHARLVELADVGHALMAEAPQAVNQAIALGLSGSA